MKQLISMVLIILVCFSLFACNNENDNNANTSTTQSEETQKPSSPEEDNQSTPEEKPYVMTEEEVFAANIVIGAAKMFKNPLSINLKNVWVYKMESLNWYYFTYEFEVKNSAGIMENVYYGNLSHIDGLTDETLTTILDEINASRVINANSMYFKENEIKAMQQGTALNAKSIQEYFLKNYK